MNQPYMYSMQNKMVSVIRDHVIDCLETNQFLSNYNAMGRFCVTQLLETIDRLRNNMVKGQ